MSSVSGGSSVLPCPPEGRKREDKAGIVEGEGVARVLWGKPWINDKTHWRLRSRCHTRGSKPPEECNRWQGNAIKTHLIRLWLLISPNWRGMCILCFNSPIRPQPTLGLKMFWNQQICNATQVAERHFFFVKVKKMHREKKRKREY